MPSILNPTLEIVPDPSAPSTAIVQPGEQSSRAFHAQVRVTCDVEFDEPSTALEGHHLRFELFADDDGERESIAPLAWGEINPNGDLLLQQRVQFFSETAAGTYPIERVGYANHFVIDEDPPEQLPFPWDRFVVRGDDEIVAVFTLTYFRWPELARGQVIDTVEAQTTIRI